ncbi:MAG TPA: hypothetical protein HPP94_12045 [Desulfuromonadales bacterium]|nr:hypothetical protein [Desulfuromonadales bacterium]
MDINHFCSRCGSAVLKSADHCDHCSAKFTDKLRCAACDYIGTEEDYTLDRCPKCGCSRLIALELKAP